MQTVFRTATRHSASCSKFDMSIHAASAVKLKEGSVAQNYLFFLADGESNIDGGARCGYVCYNYSHYCYHRQDLNQTF